MHETHSEMRSTRAFTCCRDQTSSCIRFLRQTLLCNWKHVGWKGSIEAERASVQHEQ
jgi:hypothetical protein